MIKKLLALSLAWALYSCGGGAVVDSDRLENRLSQIEAGSAFSLDTLIAGEWTHFGIVTPYMEVDSLLPARGIKCTDADLSELKTSTMHDHINTLLILRGDTLEQIAPISRAVIDFSGIADSDGLRIFSRAQAFALGEDRSLHPLEEPEPSPSE